MEKLPYHALSDSDEFEYVAINSRGHDNSVQSDTIFFTIQNNLQDKHGKAFLAKMPYPTGMCKTEDKSDIIVAKHIMVDELDDDEIYILTDDDSPSTSYTYYIKGTRFIEFINNLYNNYLSKDGYNYYFYDLYFSTMAKDENIDLTDFEDTSKIPKVHKVIIRASKVETN